MTFAEALRTRAREAPRELAFTFEDDRLTYEALWLEASRIAAGLAEARVAPGERVALLLPAGIDFVRAFAAVALAGAVPFAISPAVAPATAIGRAARVRPSAAVVPAARRGALQVAGSSNAVRLLALEDLARSEASIAEPPAPEPEDPAFLQLTSGTTGEPRFAVVSHRALAACLRISNAVFGLGAGDVLAGWVPPWHVMGLVRFIIFPVLLGVPAHLVPPAVSGLGLWLETAARVGATFTSAPDFALRSVTRLVSGRSLDLASLRFLVCGGEPVRSSTIVAFERRFDRPGLVLPAYGLAEATLGLTCARPGEPIAVDSTGTVSCGRPFPEIEIEVVDEHGGLLPRGTPGEILARSPALFSGYLDDVASETKMRRDGWLATGDWGRLGETRELFVLGRRRNLLKHGGATFAPRELEDAADAIHRVHASAAISLTHVDRPQVVQVVLVVETTDPSAPAAVDIAREVAEAVRRGLGILPGEVLLVAPGTMPRTDSGKVRHIELKRALAAGELAKGEARFGRFEGWLEEQLADQPQRGLRGILP